ncbi:hypothetical protein [Haloquadratum walsbyi]|jgi:hypothetical protein|uniref:Uncharacterized protein n=2 Tax=Haloquadratum walsbyi TaxID=293091 RepID=G0LG04_HALWC|nr:hypothetical protein [Haloquadratum walsbyi]ABC72349.1 conserved hypothetical protein [Haloquadratum walsbyi]CCC39024.1 uncharacterized protein Hqrw_1044 [Haloquadratum walsbyi C23]
MKTDDNTESCGRCSMSAVVDASIDTTDHDSPFGDNRIEVDDETLRKVSPGAWLSTLTTKLDSFAWRFLDNRDTK